VFLDSIGRGRDWGSFDYFPALFDVLLDVFIVYPTALRIKIVLATCLYIEALWEGALKGRDQFHLLSRLLIILRKKLSDRAIAFRDELCSRVCQALLN
jgi:hypothetical protein